MNLNGCDLGIDMQGFNGGVITNIAYVSSRTDLIWLECVNWSDTESPTVSLAIRLTEETKLMEWGDQIFWNNESTVWISHDSLGTITPIERVGHIGVDLDYFVANPTFGNHKWP